MTPGFEDLRLITVADLADLCGTGEDWIRRGAAARQFDWTKAGKEIKFTRAQAEAAIESRRVAAQNRRSA
ncbi:MAG TPA: hypothetical protein VFC00_30850 [Micromonosporaceae bacterium]|nr:hypothetical protein [Micromonosporaceae bacterium]